MLGWMDGDDDGNDNDDDDDDDDDVCKSPTQLTQKRTMRQLLFFKNVFLEMHSVSFSYMPTTEVLQFIVSQLTRM